MGIKGVKIGQAVEAGQCIRSHKEKYHQGSIVLEGGIDPDKSNPVYWGDTHHPALSETEGDYDGQTVFAGLDLTLVRGDRVALVFYDTETAVAAPLSVDHGAVATAVASARPGARATDLIAGLRRAVSGQRVRNLAFYLRIPCAVPGNGRQPCSSRADVIGLSFYLRKVCGYTGPRRYSQTGKTITTLSGVTIEGVYLS